MYELAKSSRDKMKAKARSLAASGTLAKDQKVDSSDWSPAEPLNADIKTGMRPVGKAREYKAGGTVAKARADRKPRKSGGRAVEKEIGVGMANKDMKAANEQREGIKHVGGMKKGGRTKKNIGGVMETLSPAYGLLRAAQRGGRDEERDTGEQMKGAMMANLANRKSGGGVKDKKALGGIDPSPKRGAAGHYKKGGKIKKAMGGSDFGYVGAESVTKDNRPVTRPKDIEDTRKREPDVRDLYDADQAKRLEEGRKKGGRAERKTGGRTRAKGKTHINIMIAAGGRKEPHMPAMPPAGGPDGGGGVMPVPMPPAAAAPPPAMPPMPMPPPPMGGGMPPMPPGRKAGGRITKIASSYKDMEAGAVSGEGRLQKTDIAKKHHGAPTRKTGGRIAKSFRDMTAGAESGKGRLQKMQIEKGQRLRGH